MLTWVRDHVCKILNFLCPAKYFRVEQNNYFWQCVHYIRQRQRKYGNAHSREGRAHIGRHAELSMTPEVVGYDAAVFSQR